MVREVIGGTAAEREFPKGHGTSFLLLIATAVMLFRLKTLSWRGVHYARDPPVLFVALALLISLHRPILISRVLLWTWIPLSLLLAHILIHRSRRRLVLLGLIIIVFAVGLDAQLFPTFSLKENGGSLLRENHDNYTADTIVISTSVPTGCLELYMPLFCLVWSIGNR